MYEIQSHLVLFLILDEILCHPMKSAVHPSTAVPHTVMMVDSWIWLHSYNGLVSKHYKVKDIYIIHNKEYWNPFILYVVYTSWSKHL